MWLKRTAVASSTVFAAAAVKSSIEEILPNNNFSSPFLLAVLLSAYVDIWAGYLACFLSATIIFSMFGGPTPVYNLLGVALFLAISLMMVSIIRGIKEVTFRKREEEARLCSIMEHVADAIISIDDHGVVKVFNPAAERMFGHSKEDIIGKDVKLLLPIVAHADHEHRMAMLRKAELTKYQYEIVGLRKDGTKFPIEICVSKFNVDGSVQYSSVLRDVSNRKDFEEKLIEENRKKDEENRKKDEFLAQLSHELRTPLSPIRNSLHVLQDPTSPEEYKATLAMIERQVSHMVRLVEDLLDVSRIVQGKISLNEIDIELSKVISSAVERSHPCIAGKNQQFEMVVDPDVIWLHADCDRLAQVISNLLNNASKYTPRRGKITLSAGLENNRAVIRVKDNGLGITADSLPHVFDLFRQDTRTLARSQGGLGVGLTVAKRIVELHQGTIEARSEGENKGSEFIVNLPTYEPVILTDSSLSLNKKKGKKEIILVVDDNVDSAKSTAMVLRGWGHEVHVSYDGVTAIEMAVLIRPSIVVLDIGLPGMNGYEVAKSLRARELGILKIIAATGYGSAKDRALSREAGIDHHLVKPVDLDAFKEILES